MTDLEKIQAQIADAENKVLHSRIDLAHYQEMCKMLEERYIEATAQVAREFYAKNGPFFARMRDDFAVVEGLVFTARSNDEMRQFAGKTVRVEVVDDDTIFIEGCPYAFFVGYLDGATI